MKFENIAEQIIALKRKDLELRSELIKKGKLFQGYNKEMETLHNHNTRKLDEIINNIGYPTQEKVGEEASEAAWLIIQHSIGQPDFMRKCRKLLEEAVRANMANPLNLAYLTDRIAVYEGGLQLYGTQFHWDHNKELNPYQFDDLVKVNQRRKSLGLNTVEEQTAIIRKQANNENHSPPKDFEKSRKDFEEWRKKKGWII